MNSKRKTKVTRRKREHDAIPRNKREEEDRLDALAALALMRREGLSAASAAEAEGTTVKKIRKYAGSALRKRGTDYVAKPSDRFIRTMTAIDAQGTRPIAIRSSKAASKVGRYFNAVDDALKGKRSALKEFRGKNYPYSRLKFVTNLKILRRLQVGGVLDNIKDIYWRGRKR